MPTKINLDALIIREDFEAQEDNEQFQTKQTVEIRDLEHEAFFYRVLRKPDFQRETSDWTPEKTFVFVKSFLDGDLIPAIILWNSPDNHVFVIDGALLLAFLERKKYTNSTLTDKAIFFLLDMRAENSV